MGIHRDESTPHMYAYIVPIDPKGKLNARHFLGECNALSKMQTDFYENVGKDHGLERGIEKSKAKHVDIKSYYARVNATEVVRTPPITLDKPKLWESKSTYGFRVAKKILKDLELEWKTLSAKASEREVENRKAKALKGELETAQKEIGDLKVKSQEGAKKLLKFPNY